MLQLVKDKDEDIRRAAIEILNQAKDPRAIESLLQATRDTDWWVSERAVDALAEIGSKTAVPRLLEMLRAGNVKTLPVVVRALGRLGDAQLTGALAPLLARPEREVRIEAIQALVSIADLSNPDAVRTQLKQQASARPDDCARGRIRTGRSRAAALRSRRGEQLRRHDPAAAARGGRARAARGGRPGARRRQLAARHPDPAPRGHHRGPLQVSRAHRPRRVRY
ncbi:PBS lyase HEAT domain protein repeat-containing protein, partial [mine drainage metagenome]